MDIRDGDTKLKMHSFKRVSCYFVVEIDDDGYYKKQVNKLLLRLSRYLNDIITSNVQNINRPSNLPSTKNWPIDLLDKKQAVGFLTKKLRIAMYGSRINNALTSKKGATYLNKRFFAQPGAIQDIFYSWTKAGFGWPCQLRGLKMNYIALPALKNIIETATGLKLGLGDIPHQIFKFYGGTKLDEHTDGLSLNQYLRVCMKTRNCSEYIRNVGIQILFHTIGGNGLTGGGTLFLHPMSVCRYTIMLLLMRKGLCGVKKMNKFLSPDKQNYPYFKNINAFNKVILRIESAGSAEALYSSPSTSKDHVINFVKDLSPAERTRIFQCNKNASRDELRVVNPASDIRNPYVIAWPRGFPHGADKNKKGHMRFTSVLPFTANLAEEKPFVTPEKIIHRVKLLGRLKNINPCVRENAMKELSLHPGYQFNAGSCHRNPQIEAKFYKYFKDMYINEKDAQAFVKMFTNTPKKLTSAQLSKKTKLEKRLLLLNSHLAKLKRQKRFDETKTLSVCGHPQHNDSRKNNCPGCGTLIKRRSRSKSKRHKSERRRKKRINYKSKKRQSRRRASNVRQSDNKK